MMRKLDQRGTAALEFCLVSLFIFITLFAIIDLGRFAITVQSLRALSHAGARALMINSCYMDAAIARTTPTCSGDPLPSDAAKEAIAPFLFNGGLTPTLNVAATGTSPYVVTASQPGFTMLFFPIPATWGSVFTAPTATTKLPFPGV